MLRSAKWAIRILAAAVAGAIVRFARRIARKPPRIWHGFWPLHLAADHVRVDSLAGYPSCMVATSLSQFAYEIYERSKIDVVWEDRGIPPNERHWRSLEHLLLHGDIWIPFFDSLFFPGRARLNHLSFRILRAAGVRIIATTQGGDIVHKMRSVTRFDWVGRWQQSYPNWDLEAHAPAARERIATFCKYADLVIAEGAYTARFLPRLDFVFKYFPVEVDRFLPRDEDDETRIPMLVHATNHRPVKGTDFVIDAVELLKRAGFEVDLRIIERVPRLEAIKLYRAADFVADQFCMGTFGCFAMESMALGKPVVSYSDQEELGMPAYNFPLINGTRDNMAEVYAALIAIPELRRRIGKASRAAAEKWMSPKALAEVWTQFYDHVWWGTPLALEKTAIFDPQRGTRWFGEDPAEAEFWPVDVSDVLPRIREAVGRVRSARGLASSE